MSERPLQCPICLDALKNPVVTPCGHMSCDACLKSHIRASPDPIMSTCPTCRSSFPIVSPDLAHVPKKYKMFISPSVRRVYIDVTAEDEDAAATIEALTEKVAFLESRVTSLRRDKTLLVDRCESAMHAAKTHQDGEKDARVAAEAARKATKEAQKKYEAMKTKYREIKAQQPSSPAHSSAKRTSTQAALDTSTATFPALSPALASRVQIVNNRPTLPIPKRPRLATPVRAEASTSSPPVFRPRTVAQPRRQPSLGPFNSSEDENEDEGRRGECSDEADFLSDASDEDDRHAGSIRSPARLRVLPVDHYRSVRDPVVARSVARFGGRSIPLP